MPYANKDFCYSSDDQAFDAFVNQNFPKFENGIFINFLSSTKVSEANYDITYSKNDGINPTFNTVQSVSFTVCDPLASTENLSDLMGFFGFGFTSVLLVAIAAHGLSSVLAQIQHKKN